MHYYLSLTWFFRILSLSAVISGATAQSIMKFGTVSMEEMTMTHYEQDSSASAVYLFQKGDFDGRTFQFTHHYRVKVLNKSGTELASRTSFRIPNKGSISGYVYNLENGQVVREKLPASSIYEEEVIKGIFVYKIFVPNVREGSVFEIQYSFIGLPVEWRFQEVIPVIHSELKMDPSSYVKFDKRYFGMHPITAIADHHWVLKNVPAFPQEPYLNSYTNYLSKIQFEIAQITFPGWAHWQFTSSWDAVGTQYAEYTYFGGVLKAHSAFLNEKAQEIKKMEISDRAKIDSCYQYIRQNMRWNDLYSPFATTFLRENFKKNHTGNYGEINLLLTAMLQKSGITAYPVLLSTRDNGIIMTYFPSVDYFNSVVSCAIVEGKEILLDAAGRHLAPGYVAWQCLNGSGLMVTPEGSRWIDLLAGNKAARRAMCTVRQNEDGRWVADITRNNSGYAYVFWAAEYQKMQFPEYNRYLSAKYPALDIISARLSKHDSLAMAMQETFQVDMAQTVDDLGEELLINPFAILPFEENPLKSPHRLYPLDFGHLNVDAFTYMIFIPEGYRVGSLPTSTNIQLPDGGGNFTFMVKQAGNTIQIQLNVAMKKAVFTEAEYENLKNFYSMILSKTNETVQLVKI